MARRPVTERIPEVVEAAMRVFGQAGYQRAQMADVAREMGVSEGALYRYVEGKDALFWLVVERALFGITTPPTQMPVPSRPPAQTLRRIGVGVSELAGTPALASALRRHQTPDPSGELRTVAGELYDVFANTRRGMDVIERSAREVPELAQVFDEAVRRPLIAQLNRYVQTRCESGQFRPVPDTGGAARFILETLVWFARHRYHDRDGHRLDDAVARATATEMVVHALVPDEPGEAGA